VSPGSGQPVRYLPTAELAPPGPGRVFRAGRTVRLGDVDVDGHLRLDSVARYAQDVASDDVRDVGMAGRWGWVVRRTTMLLLRPGVERPRFEEDITLATWCAGVGAAWAERRTTIFAAGRPAVEISGLWVCLDLDQRRPVVLDQEFLDVYGPTARTKRVPGRLVHPSPPERVDARPWLWRRTDYDAFRHVNNAALWAVVEDEAARRQPGSPVTMASVEHRAAVELGADAVVTGARDGAGDLGLWICDTDGEVLASAMVGFGSA
jgi:acyl-ACP thioesterase